MREDVGGLASEVIRAASRQRPADRVLKEALREHPKLTPEQSARVAQTVFAFYRWFGWTQTRRGLGPQVQYALQLADRFRSSPESFPPSELVQRVVPDWVKDEMIVSPEWAQALQMEPKLWIRAHRGQGSALARRLKHCKAPYADKLPDTLQYLGNQDLFRTGEFHEGKFELQDLSSQCVSVLCEPKPGETWWDACAGEGGKLLHLSDLMQNKGLIWATDKAEWRLKLLKRRTARAKVFNYRAATWDGGGKPPFKAKMDGILVDAPCSGLGTWHRNPQARWTTSPQDVKELVALQVQLLKNVVGNLKPGGKLVYSVCTLTRSETVQVIEHFEREVADVHRMDVINPLRKDASASPSLELRTEAGGGNGMFIAAWTKRAAA